MTKMTMLDLDCVDLDMLAHALEDHGLDASWWLDPETGRVESWHEDLDQEHPEDRDWVFVEPLSSRESYGDMEDFIARVRDTRAHDLLDRAIAGRGAFRRFKDTLLEFPELREAWFTFHYTRMRVRAIRWLADEGLVDPKDAERTVDAVPEPDLPEPGEPFDAQAIARDVARDLSELYGDRLRDVILFGSQARGDAHEESDIDLLVVLEDMGSAFEEDDRMDDILWHHSIENGTVIVAVPMDASEYQSRSDLFVRRVRDEGRSVA